MTTGTDVACRSLYDRSCGSPAYSRSVTFFAAMSVHPGPVSHNQAESEACASAQPAERGNFVGSWGESAHGAEALSFSANPSTNPVGIERGYVANAHNAILT